MRFSAGCAAVLCCFFLMAAAPPARALDCGECTACTPCDTACYVCSRYGEDGCLQYRLSTCGVWGPDCGGPNYVQTGYEPVGSYGVTYASYCEHHAVSRVTMTDLNNCETPNDYQFCDDVVDGVKTGIYPDCCDGNPWSCYGASGCF